MKIVYLDYNATTPVDPGVFESMRPYLEKHFGNPSSDHLFGMETRKAIALAREQVADLLNASPDEVVFTSGGTESNNMAIKGIAFAHGSRGRHIITSSVEHPATLEVCRFLENRGFEVTWLEADRFGTVDPEAVKRTLRPDSILVSIMHANNEVGTIQPIEKIAEIVKGKGIFFHTDAAQSAGKIETNVEKLGVDLLSVAGHKFYAPKGVGALYIRRGTTIEKLIHGAGHEHELRAGTENVAEIVGLGKACELAAGRLRNDAAHMREMRDMLWDKLSLGIPGIQRNGHPEHCLPNTLSVSFPEMEAGIILSGLQDVAASAGAACHSDDITVSHVLEAMKVPSGFARGTVRFSTGRYTTRAEIEQAAASVIHLMKQLQPQGREPVAAEVPAEVRLTSYTQGLGCACKLRPQALERILKTLPVSSDPRVLSDHSTSDDAAVYVLNEDTALVHTIDFFSPVVDEPYHYGAIAAANALSDIYAMGAVPLFALNIVGFPSSRLPMEVLAEILRGASDKCREAGIEILGGHTVDDNEPKFGLAVSGTVHPGKVIRNNGAQPGDAIILTKPLGTGIITTGIKRKLTSPEAAEAAIEWMLQLNRDAAEAMKKFPVTSCTDVTGFGLLGHLAEITRASGVEAEIKASAVPLMEQVKELADMDIIPGGTRNNLSYLEPLIEWDRGLGVAEKMILCDAQTSGGLLFTVPKTCTVKLLHEFSDAGISKAREIGKITGRGSGKISVIMN